MLEPFFNSFEKLINEFSWRRLIFVIILILLIIIVIFSIESYTGHFQLNRIDKSIILLDKISALGEQLSKRKDNDVKKIYDSIKQELLSLTERHTRSPEISSMLLKALTGALPWLIFSLAYISDPDGKSALIGMLFLSFIFGGIGTVIPDMPMMWLNYLGYPIISFTIVVILVLYWQKKQKG